MIYTEIFDKITILILLFAFIYTMINAMWIQSVIFALMYIITIYIMYSNYGD